MKIKWKTLLICVAIPVLVGLIAGLISSGSMAAFEELEKPPLSPPGWLFPVVWSVLYVLMGVASYLVLVSDGPVATVERSLRVYALQLFFNFCWSLIFFNLEMYYFAFVWLVALWALILTTIIMFGRISKPAAWLMVPYLLWVTFAGYLNLGIALLN